MSTTKHTVGTLQHVRVTRNTFLYPVVGDPFSPIQVIIKAIRCQQVPGIWQRQDRRTTALLELMRRERGQTNHKATETEAITAAQPQEGRPALQAVTDLQREWGRRPLPEGLLGKAAKVTS